MVKITNNNGDIFEAYGFIYITTNLLNGKKYLGKKVFDKNSTWVNYLGSGKYLSNSIKKYGRNNFSRNIIYIASSKFELEQMEEYYLNIYNCPCSSDWYNISTSSVGGDTISNMDPKDLYSYKTKMKILLSGQNNPNFGKKFSEETKLKMSEAQKGSKSKLAKCVIVTDLCGKIIKEFDTVRGIVNSDWAKKNSLSYRKIMKCLKEGLPFNNFYIKYKHEVIKNV